MKIRDDQPLPDHTKLRYEECLAKLYLEKYYSERYFNLKIKDKPDLYEDKIGIEVVESCDPKHREALKMFYTMNHVSEKEKIKHKKRMEELGTPYMGHIQIWPAIDYKDGIESEEYLRFYRTIENKLDKLNNNEYKLFESNELFVFTELLYLPGWNPDILRKLIKISSNYKLKFERIYMFTPNFLINFKIIEQSYNGFEFHDNGELAYKARKMVIDAEE